MSRRAIGPGVILYAQLDPDRFDADQLTYFRITRRRQTHALSQVLANFGATFAADGRFFMPEAESPGPPRFITPKGTRTTIPATIRRDTSAGRK